MKKAQEISLSSNYRLDSNGKRN